MARRSGVSWPACAASSPVLCGGSAPVNAAMNTSCMTALASGNSNGCGPACSPTMTGLRYPCDRMNCRAVSR